MFLVGLAAAVAIAAFMAAFIASGLVTVATNAGMTARDSLRVMGDASLDDDAKERAVRAASLRLFGAFGSIALRSALTLSAPLAVIWLGDMAGIAEAVATTDFLLRWDVIIGATVIGFAAWALARRLT